MSGEPVWTLDELCLEVGRALSVGYGGVPSERVRDVPDRRTVRYYTTLGLVDRPAVRGRMALYGRRHLLQLVAIKRLQSRGQSLHEIQQRVPHLSNAELEALADVPPQLETLPAETPPEPLPREFWKATPPAPQAPAAAAEFNKTLHGVPLGAGAILLLPLRRALDDNDLEAVRTAAAPLLRLLQTRDLID